MTVRAEGGCPPGGDLDWQTDALLTRLGGEPGWCFWLWGRTSNLLALGASRQVAGCADVVILRTVRDAVAYRTAALPTVNIWAPTDICWHYVGTTVHVLRAVLSLPPEPTVPMPWYPTPTCCAAPEAARRPARYWPRRPR